MGIEFLRQQCGASATETDALLWCIKKEGICCGICSDMLASLGTRVGLSVAVFFATLVIVVDGAETPFVFLTTSLQALAYLLVVLWEGLGGTGISRFHSYYALVCSFGWLSPFAAASLTATHYGYGGNHHSSGTRLSAYRTDLKHALQSRASSRSPRKQVSRSDISPRAARSPTPSRQLSSQLSSRRHRDDTREHRPLLDSTDTPESSPNLRVHLRTDPIPIMERRRSQRIPDDLKQKPPLRQTPLQLLELDALARSDYEKENGTARKDEDEDGVRRARSNELDRDKELDLKSLSRETTSEAASQSVPNLRRRYTGATSYVGEQQSTRPVYDRVPSPQPGRYSVDTAYSPSVLDNIAQRVKFGRWRRWGYPLSVLALWILWLSAFLLIHETLPSFTLSQTDCLDPEGTEFYKYSSITLLALGPLVILAFVLNYHTQWLPHQLRRIFDYNRDGSLHTRVFLPGCFSGLVFGLWQAFLWQGYHLASQPDSSLMATTEQSTTFATVLSLALTIKPVSDLVKAVTKIYKRKFAERDEAHQASMLPGHTPTALPDLQAFQLPQVPRFQPLEPSAMGSGREPSLRAGNRRRSPNVVPSKQPSSRTRHGSSTRPLHNP